MTLCFMIIVIIIISNNSGPWWLCNLDSCLILLCVQLTENLFLFSTIIQVETDAVKTYGLPGRYTITVVKIFKTKKAHSLYLLLWWKNFIGI